MPITLKAVNVFVQNGVSGAPVSGYWEVEID